MSLFIAFVAILVLAALVGWLGFSRARRLRSAGRMHSLPFYHGAHSALWAAIPALLFLAAWVPIQHRMVDQAVLESPAGQALPDFAMQRDAIIAEARDIASGRAAAGFNPESAGIAPVIRSAQARFALIGGGIAILIAAAMAGLALRRFHGEQLHAVPIEQQLEIVRLAQPFDELVTIARQADLDLVLAILWKGVRHDRAAARADRKTRQVSFLSEVRRSPDGVAAR